MTSTPVVGSPHEAANSSTTPGKAAGGGIDTMFMQLLMTQLRSQDPLSPMDPSNFVQQLAQVTTLDQLTQINQLLQNTLGKSSS